MSQTMKPSRGHLEPEELELFLPIAPSTEERAREPSADQRDHVAECERCRRELSGLRALHERLAALPYLSPSEGFAKAVMSRVRLPVPWYARAWSYFRERWLAVAIGAVGVGVTTGVMAWWLSTQPGLTLGGLMEFTLQQIGAFVWTVVMAAARPLWATGLPDLVGTAAGRISLIQALAGMATFSLASLGVAAGMTKLMRQPRLAADGGRS